MKLLVECVYPSASHVTDLTTWSRGGVQVQHLEPYIYTSAAPPVQILSYRLKVKLILRDTLAAS